MTASDAGKVEVQHLCKLAGVSRASYYRRFEARAPREADVELTSHIQLLCLRHRFYDYRRITALLRRSGVVVNAKRVQRLMREDNLIGMRSKPFAPPTSDSRHGFLVVPDLLRGLVPSGPDQIWVADITYIRLRETFAYLASFSTASRARWWAGRWLPISMPRLPWKGWIRRLPIASPSPPVSFIIPIVACNMLRPNIASASPAMLSPSA